MIDVHEHTHPDDYAEPTCDNPGCARPVHGSDSYCSIECGWEANTKNLAPAPWTVTTDEKQGTRVYMTRLTCDVPAECEFELYTNRPADMEAERVLLAGLRALYGEDIGK